MKVAISKPILKANSDHGTPKGLRTTITTGLVKGMMLNIVAIGPWGSWKTVLCAMTKPKIRGRLMGSMNCCTSVS